MIIPDKQQWLDGARAIIANTAADHLGIEIIDVSEDTIDLRMPLTNKARQPMGILHGGISMVLAESAASMHATYGIDLSEKVPVGIEINGSHLRSASDGTILARGRVLRRTSSFIFHQIDIIHEETGDVLATARVTNYYKRLPR